MQKLVSNVCDSRPFQLAMSMRIQHAVIHCLEQSIVYIFLFTYSSSWYGILAPVVNEFIIIKKNFLTF